MAQMANEQAAVAGGTATTGSGAPSNAAQSSGTHNSAAQKPIKAKSDEVSRLTVFLHALSFVFGFGVIFTLLGASASLLGVSLTAPLDISLFTLLFGRAVSVIEIIQTIGAILLFIFGLVTLGVFRWLANQITSRFDVASNPAAAGLVDFLNFFNTLLYTEKRVTEMHNVNRNWGFASSFMMGVSFSAGWVPCVGPILASILFLASDGTTAAQGATLLAIYSLGLGIPFLMVGAAFGSASKFLRKLNRHSGIVSIVSGLFLLFVAYLLWFDQLAILVSSASFLNEWVFLLEDWVAATFGISSLSTSNVSVLGSAPLALVAGIISFISPCVLPLVPAYIGYLSGASLNN